MNKERDLKHWKEMFDSLTDPEEQAKARRKTEKEKRINEKKLDTGLWEKSKTMLG